MMLGDAAQERHPQLLADGLGAVIAEHIENRAEGLFAGLPGVPKDLRRLCVLCHLTLASAPDTAGAVCCGVPEFQ
jgi:hypothetical protein